MEEKSAQVPQEVATSVPPVQKITPKKPAIVIAIAVLILLFLFIGVWIFYRHQQKKNYSPEMQNHFTNAAPVDSQMHEEQNGDDFTRQYGQGCTGSGTKMFGVSPMNTADIGAIVPMGLMVDAHVTPIDHLYFSPKNFHGPRDEYPVFAMADGTIVDIEHRTNFVGSTNLSPGGKTDEYRVAIQYSCTFYSYFDLLTSLAPTIKSQIGDQSYASVHIPIKQGQEIGRIGGQTLDFAVWNTDVTLKGFIVPTHYNGEPWKIHTDNPFTYFQEPIRSQLLALDERTVEPRQGKIDYDIDGKLVGNWFKEGTGGYDYERTNPQSFWTTQLSIVYDYLDPTQIRISIGDYAGKSKQFGVLGNTPDPATVDQSSGIIKYQLAKYAYYDPNGNQWEGSTPIKNVVAKNSTQVEGTVLVQMTDKRKIKFEAFPGKTSSEVNGFDSSAKIYER